MAKAYLRYVSIRAAANLRVPAILLLLTYTNCMLKWRCRIFWCIFNLEQLIIQDSLQKAINIIVLFIYIHTVKVIF